MSFQAVIFDLDGVLVSTDELHYQAWKVLADEEGIHFDRTINERLRGVSRMESLEIILELSNTVYSQSQKQTMAEVKNTLYRTLLNSLAAKDVLPGSLVVIKSLKGKNIRLAIGSSSKNARTILEKTGLLSQFNVIVDGNDIMKGKPDPEVFLLAASRLGVSPDKCLVIEDADAGVKAALKAGMSVLAVGSAIQNPLADFKARTLEDAVVILNHMTVTPPPKTCGKEANEKNC